MTIIGIIGVTLIFLVACVYLGRPDPSHYDGCFHPTHEPTTPRPTNPAPPPPPRRAVHVVIHAGPAIVTPEDAKRIAEDVRSQLRGKP